MIRTALLAIVISALALVGIGATAQAAPARCTALSATAAVKASVMCNPNAASNGFSPNVPAPDKSVTIPDLVKVIDVEATLVTPEVSHLEARSHTETIGGQVTTNRSGK